MAETEFFVGDQYRIAYAWSHGPSPNPLVVVHGLGDSSIHTYAPRFARSVLKNTPALFIDLPGFGESSAADAFPGTIEALAEAVMALHAFLRLDNAPIFAHSMGANVAIAIGAARPKQHSPMILAEPLLDPQDSVLASTIVRFGKIQFVERGFAMLKRATSLQAKRGDVAAEAFLPVLAMAQPRAAHRAAESLLARREPSFISSVRSIIPPPVLLVGERTESEIIANIEQFVPITRIAGAGHNMMVEAEAATACVILDIVDGVNQD